MDIFTNLKIYLTLRNVKIYKILHKEPIFNCILKALKIDNALFSKDLILCRLDFMKDKLLFFTTRMEAREREGDWKGYSPSTFLVFYN